MAYAAKYLASALVALAAAYLAYHGKDGWGWLVFVAFVLASASI